MIANNILYRNEDIKHPELLDKILIDFPSEKSEY